MKSFLHLYKQQQYINNNNNNTTMPPPGPPPLNPILSAYESFLRETPLVTRYTLTTLVCSWCLSFLVDASFALNTVPYFTIYNLELYRIVVSPLICQSALSLLFAYFSVMENGKRLEHSLGSTGFACFMLIIGCTTNIIFCALCWLLYRSTNDEGYLWWQSSGIWTILFGVVATECSKAPSHEHRRFVVVQIPTRLYPLSLWIVFALLTSGNMAFAYFLSLGVGYAYGYGYLDKLKLSPTRLHQWEQSILLHFTQRQGWVVGHAATGDEAWANSTTYSNSTSTTSTTTTSMSAPGIIIPPKDPTTGFVGTGRALGSTQVTKNPKAAMLEAAERRASQSNDNNV